MSLTVALILLALAIVVAGWYGLLAWVVLVLVMNTVTYHSR